MPYILLVLSVVGLILSIYFIAMLISLSVGWKHKYDAFISQETLMLPKARRYGISIFRRKALARGAADLFATKLFSKTILFSVTQIESNKDIPFFNSGWGHSKRNASVTFPAGYFDAPDAGNYLITCLDTSAFRPDDKIVIRKYVSLGKVLAFSFGLTFSFILFLAGIVIRLVLYTY